MGGLSGRDTCERGTGTVGYHSLPWLWFETTNLFSKFKAMPKVVWSVENNVSQDGG